MLRVACLLFLTTLSAAVGAKTASSWHWVVFETSTGTALGMSGTEGATDFLPGFRIYCERKNAVRITIDLHPTELPRIAKLIASNTYPSVRIGNEKRGSVINAIRFSEIDGWSVDLFYDRKKAIALLKGDEIEFEFAQKKLKIPGAVPMSKLDDFEKGCASKT